MKRLLRKKRIQALFLTLVCTSIFLSACKDANEGNEIVPAKETVSDEVSGQMPEEVADNTSGQTPEENVSKKDESQMVVEPSVSEDVKGTDAEVHPDKLALQLKKEMVAGTITQEEKDFFSEYFTQQEIYGFLHSDYDRPQDVDMYPVLYGGAGINTFDYTKKEREEIAGEYDLFKVFEEDLNALLMDTIGLTNDQLTNPAVIVDTYGQPAYYGSASDSNYTMYTCIGGYSEGNTYTLASTSASVYGGEDIMSITVVEKKDDGKCRILENYTFGLYYYWDSDNSSEWKDGAPLLDNTHSYTSEEIKNLIPACDYFLARNEIYALHGYIFNDPVLRIFFGEKEWYLPTVESKDFSDSVFSETEKHNLEVLKQLEEAQ